MSELDDRPRFPDGDLVGPIARERSYGAVGVLVLLIVLAVSFVLTLLFTRSAQADEPGDVIYSHADRDGELECIIDSALRVRGNKRAACVGKLETAVRLARAEQKVNERKGRR